MILVDLFVICLIAAVVGSLIYTAGNNILNARLKSLREEADKGRQARKVLANIESMVFDHKAVTPGDALLASMILTELRQNKALE